MDRSLSLKFKPLRRHRTRRTLIENPVVGLGNLLTFLPFGLQDVTSGDSAAALADSCAALAAYFNSRLHEYVFGPQLPLM